MRSVLFWLVVAAIGVVNAALLHIFEFVGVEGANWLWNDLIPTDQYRWLVIPVAVVFGVLLTALFFTTVEAVNRASLYYYAKTGEAPPMAQKYGLSF